MSSWEGTEGVGTSRAGIFPGRAATSPISSSWHIVRYHDTALTYSHAYRIIRLCGAQSCAPGRGMWIEAVRSNCRCVHDRRDVAPHRCNYSSLAYRMSHLPVRFAIVLLVQQPGAESVATTVWPNFLAPDSYTGQVGAYERLDGRLRYSPTRASLVRGRLLTSPSLTVNRNLSHKRAPTIASTVRPPAAY